MRRTRQEPADSAPITVVWDGSDYLAEQGAATNVAYTNIDGQVVHENRAGAEAFYVPDPLGNTAALVDTTGALTDTWTYWPYGEVQSHGGASMTPFTYVGTWGYYADAPNRNYVRARVQDPELGRWLTTDRWWPLEAAYGYARTAPLARADFFGTAPQGSNYGSCAVFVCSEYSGIFNSRAFSGVPSHQYMCVQGPYGGCSGGHYPDPANKYGWGPGYIGNIGESCRSRIEEDGSGGRVRIDCYQVSDDCDIAASVCACNKENIKERPAYRFGINDCWRYPFRLFDCACNKVPAHKRNDCLQVIEWKLKG